MIQCNRIRTVLVTVASIILLAPVGSVAQEFPDRDAREISSYVLTEAALAKYKRATSNLGELAKTVPATCDDDSDEEPESLDSGVARINAAPGAQAAIQAAGMTTREFVVFTWSLFQSGMASWALTQPGGKLPPGVSQANVDFIRTHEQALRNLDRAEDSDPCDDRESEEENIDEEPTE